LNLLKLQVGAGPLWSEFDEPADDTTEPSIPEAVDQGIFDAVPTAFESGILAWRSQLEVVLDTRGGSDRPASDTGVRVSASASHAVSFERPSEDQWLHYRGGIGGFVNTGYFRTIGLRLQATFVDPLREAGVPFTELVSVRQLTEHVSSDRLLGRSALWATLEYRWPIWVILDGIVDVSFGNVFGPRLDDFEPDLLRWSVGFGVVTTGSRDNAFAMTFGFLGDTFREGGGFDDFKFFVGSRSTF